MLGRGHIWNSCISLLIHSSWDVNHSEISDQSDHCWRNIIVIWRHIVPHIHTCCIYATRSEFYKFEAVQWIKMLWIRYLDFLWNYFQTHYIDVRWCTSKWTLGYRRKKRAGGVTPRLVSNFISYTLKTLKIIQSLTKKKLHFFDNIRRIFLVNWTEWGIHRYKLS